MTFNPTWKSPPGDTISDLLSEKGWCLDRLSLYLGLNKSSTRELMNGELLIDEALGLRLCLLLGSSPEFWINRYRQYKA